MMFRANISVIAGVAGIFAAMAAEQPTAGIGKSSHSGAAKQILPGAARIFLRIRQA